MPVRRLAATSQSPATAMNTAPNPKSPEKSGAPFGPPFSGPVTVMILLGLLALATLFAREQSSTDATISYDEFVRQVKAKSKSFAKR